MSPHHRDFLWPAYTRSHSLSSSCVSLYSFPALFLLPPIITHINTFLFSPPLQNIRFLSSGTLTWSPRFPSGASMNICWMNTCKHEQMNAKIMYRLLVIFFSTFENDTVGKYFNRKTKVNLFSHQYQAIKMLQVNNSKNPTCIHMFIAALFTIATTWKQPRCPLTDEWIKLWYIDAMENYLAIKRNECESVELKWINLVPIIQREVSQKGKNKYHILMHIYRI